MIMKKGYEVIELDILKCGGLDSKSLSSREKDLLENKDIIYIYLGKNNVYIGQTLKLSQRHKQHLSKLDGFEIHKYEKLYVVYGQLIDKNLNYIEKRLISLFIADNEKSSRRVKIDNKNLGNNSNHPQDNKDLDTYVITPLWENELYLSGRINNKNVSMLKRSILAKYSPFMGLTPEQQKIIDNVIKNNKNFLIEGGAGTGKTVLMTNIVAQIYDKFDGLKKIGVVVKANWRNNASKIFDAYGISNNITVGTWGNLVNSGEHFDYIVVDEAHRLPRFYGKLHPTEMKQFGDSRDKHSLELLDSMSESLILLYDKNQSIRPSDIPSYDYKSYIKDGFEKIELSTQLRIDVHDKNKDYTAEDYITGIRYILQISEDSNFNKDLFNNHDKDSYFGLVDSIKDLFAYVGRMDNVISSSQNRVIAGYSKEWLSKNNDVMYDWVDGENKWKWNSHYVNWINRPNSKNEIGSIHAVQGVDINCVGLIIGRDITYKNNKVIAVKDNYFDKNGVPVKDDFSEEEFSDYIKNIYYTLMTRGIDGIRIYIEDKDFRNYFISSIR